MRGDNVDPEYEVEDLEDLSELLARAGNWAERDVGADVVAAEFRQAREFVEEQLDDNQLVMDGGEVDE